MSYLLNRRKSFRGSGFTNTYSTYFNESVNDERASISGIVGSLSGLGACSFVLNAKVDNNATNECYFTITQTAFQNKITLSKTSSDRLSLAVRPAIGDSNRTILTPNDGSWNHAGTWKQIVGTIDIANDAMKLYADGALLSTSGTTTWTATAFSSEEGTDSRYGMVEATQHLQGKMDEPAWYNRVLTLTEVQEIWASGVTQDLSTLTTSGNLLHWWRAGDDAGDSGSTWIDQVGSLDATLVNMGAGDIVADVL